MNAQHENIDDTIAQIDYIQQMQNDEIFDEMVIIIKGIKAKKDLLDNL